MKHTDCLGLEITWLDGTTTVLALDNGYYLTCECPVGPHTDMCCVGLVGAPWKGPIFTTTGVFEICGNGNVRCARVFKGKLVKQARKPLNASDVADVSGIYDPI